MLFPHRTSPLLCAASLIVLAWTGAAAAADFRIENITVPNSQGDGTVTIKLIDVRGSNLSQEEFSKLYNPATPKEEAFALVRKLQVDSVSVPEVVVTRTGKEPGTIAFRGYQLLKYDQGRFAKLALASVDGKFTTEAQGGEATVKAGQLTIEDADFSKMFEAGAKGSFADGSSRVGKFEFRDFEVRFPEKTPGGPLLHTVRIAAVTGASTYAGDLPLKSSAEARGIVFIPAAQSGAAAAMAQFGYQQVDVGLKGAGVYNPATKAYDLSDFSINGVNAGVLSLAGLFGSVGPEAFNGAQMARLGALMAADVSSITLRYADSGLFEKALVFYAKSAGKDPGAVRQEWAGMIAGILPMVLGGDPGALKVASALSDFVKAPKSLMISLKGRNGPVRFADLSQIKDPTELIKQVEIDASANR